MLNRKYNLKLDLQFRCNNSNMEFNQFDKNTSDFFMQINRSGKEIDLSKALVTLMVIKPNGNVDSQFLEVAENGVYANLKPSLKDIPGDYQCRTIVTVRDETVIPEQIFTYTVNEDKFLSTFNTSMTTNEDYTLLTDILGRLSTIETDEQQRQINEAERILNEEARKVAENNRVEAELNRAHNDADREKAEATRESNEFNRKTSESARIEAEVNRVKAESNRVDAEALRVEAENLRNNNYNFMTSDEERRRNEENARIEAEKLRKQAETTRINQESQRRTTEQARVLKENERNSNEVSREANEVSRKANEEKRVQAETNRANRYDNFITDAESAANSFKTYTSTAKQEEETRKTNELARVEAEDRRTSNEIKRISDESARKDNENRRLEAETNRQSKFDAKIIEVDKKVIEVNVAKDTVIADTEEAINTMKEDVANAIAVGTNDLEVKEARKDLKGKTHESLKLRIESDFEGLKESQDMAYVTDKCYLVCKETKNGTVKDLKVSGKSLINKATIDIALGHTNTNTGEALSNIKKGFTSNYRSAKPSTEYVAKFKNVVSNKARIIIMLFNDDRRLTEVKTWSTDINEMKFTTTQETNRIVMSVVCDDAEVSSQTLQEAKELYQPLLLESSEVDLCNGYFEGIASVGNGVDKIEVSSMNNGNILNSELVKAGVNGDTGKLSISSSGSGTVTQQEIIPVVPNMKLYYKSIGERTFRGGGNTFLYKYGINNEYLGRDTCVTFNPIDIPSNCYGVRVAFTDFELSKDYPADKYGVVFSQFENFVDTPVKQDKKPVLFKDVDGNWKPIAELRGLDTVCDTIELHNDGKYYHHIRTEKLLLDGINEDSRLFEPADISNNGENTISFVMTPKLKAFQMGEVISNRFVNLGKYWMYKKTEEGMTSGHGRSAIFIRLFKNKLSTLDKRGFMSYFQANNLTVIYQLAEEKVFEVNPLFLEAFEGEIMISINSGIINAPMEFKLTSSLPNLVSLNQKRIKELENQMITMFKSVLNGDMRTLAETIYPEDFIEGNRPMFLI